MSNASKYYAQLLFALLKARSSNSTFIGLQGCLNVEIHQFPSHYEVLPFQPEPYENSPAPLPPRGSNFNPLARTRSVCTTYRAAAWWPCGPRA